MRSRAVVVLIAAIDVVLVASYLAARADVLRGVGLVALCAWTVVIARGVLDDRTWAPGAALLTFGAMAIVAAVLSVRVLLRIQAIQGEAPPRLHLVAPALVTIFAGAITALVAGGVRAATAPDRDPPERG